MVLGIVEIRAVRGFISPAGTALRESTLEGITLNDPRGRGKRDYCASVSQRKQSDRDESAHGCTSMSKRLYHVFQRTWTVAGLLKSTPNRR